MSGGVADWLVTTGRGDRPTLRWSFTVDAQLADLSLSRETGEVVAADRSGGIYVFDRRGKVRSLVRTRHRVRSLAWADTGEAGAVVLDGNMLGWFDRKLQFKWTRELPDEILTVGIDPYGTHVAAGLANGVNLIYTEANKKASRFESVRPVKHIRFLTNSTELVVASEYGFIGRYNLTGLPVWTSKLWSTVGDLASTGDGRFLFLAGFAHGIQAFEGQSGDTRGTFVCDGTVGLVTCGYTKRHIIASTLEGTLFSVDDSGSPRWNVTVPEEIKKIVLSPLGDFMICGFESGRIMRLDMPY